MMIVNVRLWRMKVDMEKGQAKMEHQNVTQVQIADVDWPDLTRPMLGNHPKVHPLIKEGWNIEGFALVGGGRRMEALFGEDKDGQADA